MEGYRIAGRHMSITNASSAFQVVCRLKRKCFMPCCCLFFFLSMFITRLSFCSQQTNRKSWRDRRMYPPLRIPMPYFTAGQLEIPSRPFYGRELNLKFRLEGEQLLNLKVFQTFHLQWAWFIKSINLSIKLDIISIFN